ncbi:hypothetical protein SKAU_G00051620 [Synaphobranchus kaupii]|uniref:Uncharacterized protein n=1 Tax=Synaphobranchus kaupii TaxID=118154 RepID=A0A9Q1J9U7_SYNKA|nr:hypothetical protein SKAU_G00051620 [Synaphobranchus kaupii]
MFMDLIMLLHLLRVQFLLRLQHWCLLLLWYPYLFQLQHLVLNLLLLFQGLHLCLALPLGRVLFRGLRIGRGFTRAFLPIGGEGPRALLHLEPDADPCRVGLGRRQDGCGGEAGVVLFGSGRTRLSECGRVDRWGAQDAGLKPDGAQRRPIRRGKHEDCGPAVPSKLPASSV